MTKKMHRNSGIMKKFIEPTTEGKCPYCKARVQSLEHHIKDMHREMRGVGYV